MLSQSCGGNLSVLTASRHRSVTAAYDYGELQKDRLSRLPVVASLSLSYLKRNFALCSVASLNLTTSIRHIPLQDLSVFQTKLCWSVVAL